jgi:hypothetical protein
MSTPLVLPACQACGHAIWPPRPVCPRCAGTVFEPHPPGDSVIEETTSNGEVRLASVRTDAGPVVIARLAAEARPGATVELERSDVHEGGTLVIAMPVSAAAG